MPVPEPPSEDVHQVLELLRVAREGLRTARMRLLRVREWRREPHLDRSDAMALRVQQPVRELEVERWAQEVARLEHQARRMGLHP
jgi:hypothetical protein